MPGSQADDFQRVGQAGEVVVQTEEFSGEGPQLFGDGDPQDEAGVAHRHDGRRGRNPSAVQIC